jgi:hypothetical protein
MRHAGSLLIGSSLLVCTLGLVAVAGRFYADWPDHGLHSLLSLSYEGNLPTWHASMLAFVCALLLLACADAAERDRLHLRALAAGFAAISIDEVIGLHETLGGLFDRDEALLYFDWVIPGAIIVAVVGALFVPFLRRLPRKTARRFVAAGALYVGGAVGMELPLGAWASEHGEDDLGYALIDWIEETLEVAGLTVFALTLLARLREPDPGSTPT